jgi:hypothetical protein
MGRGGRGAHQLGQARVETREVLAELAAQRAPEPRQRFAQPVPRALPPPGALA